MWLQCASRTVLGLVIGTVLLLTVDVSLNRLLNVIESNVRIGIICLAKKSPIPRQEVLYSTATTTAGTEGSGNGLVARIRKSVANVCIHNYAGVRAVCLF